MIEFLIGFSALAVIAAVMIFMLANFEVFWIRFKKQIENVVAILIIICFLYAIFFMSIITGEFILETIK